MNEVKPTTPAEAKKSLAALHQQLTTWQAGLDSAKEQLDQPAAKIAEESIEALAGEAIEYAKLLTTEDVSDRRALTLIKAAAAGCSPAQLKKIAEAARVSSKVDGIVLPSGRYEKLSRGKGWCRLGSGSNAVWADRTDDGGYLVSSPGKWVVGSNDGYNRKDSTDWKVEKVGDYWIAN